MQDNVTKQYRIGGLVWELTGPDFMENEKLEPFSVQGQQADLSVKIALADTPSPSQLPLLHRDIYTEYHGEGDRRERVVYLEGRGTVLLSEREEESGNRTVVLARDCLVYYGHRYPRCHGCRESRDCEHGYWSYHCWHWRGIGCFVLLVHG